jgi:cyclic-di-AMP phosphodiesterase
MGIVKQIKPLTRTINRAKNIFLMAHSNLDLDALGSCIGMVKILEKKRKNCYIIINDTTHELGVEKVLQELEGCINIIKSKDLDDYLDKNPNKNLLMILDTNKKDLLQSTDILSKIENKVVIDHHDLDKNSLKAGLMIIDDDVSSTCEMITELVEYYDIELGSYYATVLLAGIVLDTNNFTLRTNAETFYAAYYLSSLGASAKKVQYLLKQDIADYTERQKLLTDIEVLNDHIAFTKAGPYTIYRREDLAKVADTLLFFNNIEAAFVIGKIDKDTIGISARSLGNFDLMPILNTFGGGGTEYNGAAKVDNTTISKVEERLKKELLKEEGK